MTRPTILLLLPALAACGGDSPSASAAPPRPSAAAATSLQGLAPFLPTLRELAARFPLPPSPAVQRGLREYGDLALRVVEADERTATRAERALLDSEHVLWVLEPALGHENVGARRRAAWLLGRSRASIAVFPLLLRLKYENDPEAIVWVAVALHRLGNDTGLAWLDQAIGQAATAQLAGEQAIAICRAQGIAVGEQPTYAELQAALRTLSSRWHEVGVGCCTEAPPYDLAAVDACAAAHLAVTEGTQLRPVDDARYVLTRTGRIAIPLLRRALGAAEPYLRTMALQVLAEIGPPAQSSSDAVLPLLADPLTAAYAMRTLGETGAADAAPRLRQFLDAADSELRAAAANALGQLRDAAAGERLAALLADAAETQDVRVQAAFARLRLGEDPAAAAFLAEREQRGDYHAPTLARLRERLQPAPR
jgi:HEAT repeat protein